MDWGPKELSGGGPDSVPTGRGTSGEGVNTSARPDLLAVDILNLIRKRAAMMRPLAIRTVAACFSWLLSSPPTARELLAYLFACDQMTPGLLLLAVTSCVLLTGCHGNSQEFDGEQMNIHERVRRSIPTKNLVEEHLPTADLAGEVRTKRDVSRSRAYE